MHPDSESRWLSTREQRESLKRASPGNSLGGRAQNVEP